MLSKLEKEWKKLVELHSELFTNDLVAKFTCKQFYSLGRTAAYADFINTLTNSGDSSKLKKNIDIITNAHSAFAEAALSELNAAIEEREKELNPIVSPEFIDLLNKKV